MKWTLGLPTDLVDRGDEFVAAASISRMAQAVEAVGADACHVTDHPFPPVEFVEHGGHHALDPFVALSVAAAATSRLRLHTNVLIAAYRNPILVAHATATLDAVSGGRLVLGVGVGYLRDEFERLGVEFGRRGAVLDATLDALRTLWSGEPVDGHRLRPMPRGRIPIWVGGNSDAAIRRVVRVGDGWSPFPASAKLAGVVGTAPLAQIDDLATSIDRLRAAADDAGRVEPLDVCCTPFSHPHHLGRFDAAALREEAEQLAEIGVTWMSVRLPAPSLAGFCEFVDQFGEEIVRHTGGP